VEPNNRWTDSWDQDKATVEMECMEEGYLAKIVQGDGAKEIKVGEVHTYGLITNISLSLYIFAVNAYFF
jgi:hypothetical protein